MQDKLNLFNQFKKRNISEDNKHHKEKEEEVFINCHIVYIYMLINIIF